MKFGSSFLLIFIVGLSSFAQAGPKSSVKHFTADEPADSVMYEYIRFWNGYFWVNDENATANAAMQGCKEYSFNTARTKAVQKCATAIGNINDCSNASYSFRILELSKISNYEFRCNYEVTISVQDGWH
jgi:hypothetical protein